MQVFVRVIHFLEQSDEKFRGRNAKFRAPEFFFRGSKFLFRGSDEKIPVQKLFRGGSGGVFLSRWDFFPDTFPASFCRRNPPAGFPAGRASAPGVSRVPSEGQVWRGFRDILISARRVCLRFFRAVPSGGRIRESQTAKMSKLSTRTRKFILSMEGCAQGAHFLSRRNPDNVPLQGGIVITVDFERFRYSLIFFDLLGRFKAFSPFFFVLLRKRLSMQSGNMTERKKKVLVGMSGGIDSSAVCLMLQEQGYEVVGVTMRVWDLPRQFAVEGQELPDFILEAKALAARLGMAHYVADEREAFRQTVVRHFIDEYLAGRTPNPCVMCNPTFKFRMLTDWADRLGCDYIATGHYVQVCPEHGRYYLHCGVDAGKDQSYFLWRLGQDVLSRCLFPLGGMRKSDVRDYLVRKGFEMKAREGESMEVCFIDKDYRDFLREQVPDLDSRVGGGKFVDAQGRTLGTHAGFPFYTVGQRKGLGIALGRPAYVLRVNARKNTVVLGDEAQLAAEAMLVNEACMVNEADLEGDGVAVRIRYRSRPIPCRVSRVENRFPTEVPGDWLWLVRFGGEASAVTPGQSAVFYAGDRLLGGATICSQHGLQAYLMG